MFQIGRNQDYEHSAALSDLANERLILLPISPFHVVKLLVFFIVTFFCL